MSQRQLPAPDWIRKLTCSLQGLVSYERDLENEMSSVRWQIESQIGISSGGSHDWRVNARRRASRYSFLNLRSQNYPSKYQEHVYRQLNTLLDVLLEHPAIEKAAEFREKEWVIGLYLGISRIRSHQMIFMLIGLVDYAIEHTPEAAARALTNLVQRGEDKDLISYSIVLFRGLHVENRFDFSEGISLVSFEEARQFMSERLVPSMLRGNGVTDDGPISAVIAEIKWGPAFIPAGHGEHEWPVWPETFRDDALLLIDLLAFTHELRVVSTGWRTAGVNRKIERLLRGIPFLDSVLRDATGRNELNLKPPTAPVVSADALAESAQLFSAMPRDNVMWRMALSRLTSSLDRTGVHAAFDKIIDVAIALEIMYEIDVARGKGGQLSRRARYLIGRDREDNRWIKKTAKALYDVRSDIVHGTIPKNTDQVYMDGLRLGRRTLAHLIRSGPPSDWERR